MAKWAHSWCFGPDTHLPCASGKAAPWRRPGLHTCFQWQCLRSPAGFHWFQTPCVAISLAACCWDEGRQLLRVLSRESLRAACALAARAPAAGGSAPHRALRLCRPRSSSPAQSWPSTHHLRSNRSFGRPSPARPSHHQYFHGHLSGSRTEEGRSPGHARELCLCRFPRLHARCVKMFRLLLNPLPPKHRSEGAVDLLALSRRTQGLNALGASQQANSGYFLLRYKNRSHPQEPHWQLL